LSNVELALLKYDCEMQQTPVSGMVSVILRQKTKIREMKGKKQRISFKNNSLFLNKLSSTCEMGLTDL